MWPLLLRGGVQYILCSIIQVFTAHPHYPHVINRFGYLSQRSYVYTLEGKPPSVFVRPVVGEGLRSLTAFVQNSQRG
jgi:hypothetical protein